ncbi:unnamed protein product, partial [Ascophyllum nodosum]
KGADPTRADDEVTLPDSQAVEREGSRSRLSLAASAGLQPESSEADLHGLTLKVREPALLAPQTPHLVPNPPASPDLQQQTAKAKSDGGKGGGKKV